MTKTTQKIACLALLAILTLNVAACNTMEGLGEDAQAAGRGLENAAQDNKGY